MRQKHKWAKVLVEDFDTKRSMFLMQKVASTRISLEEQHNRLWVYKGSMWKMSRKGLRPEAGR